MRKLFLTSFKFKTGETVYEQQRLVVVTDKDFDAFHRPGIRKHVKHEVEYEIAYYKLREWFPTEFPESEWISGIAYPSIDQPIESGSAVIAGAWMPEFFGNNRLPLPKEDDNSRSKDLLIDVTGWRLTFRVGYFSYSQMKWVLYDKEAEKMIDLEGLKWSDLPLNEK